jgi:hypothetical protein
MMARKENFDLSGTPLAHGLVPDAEDISAALLLRHVENFLRDGQPRHAIAHICDMTGVDRDQAAAFVADLQANVFK